MKKYGIAILACAITLASGSHLVEARESTRSYSCSALKQLVKRRGAIVMDTKRRGVFRRFVANRSYCLFEEAVRGYSVPAADGKCRLKICVPVDPFDKPLFWN